MRRLSLSLLLLAAMAMPPVSNAQQRRDYLSALESDYLREAQELGARIRTFGQLADNRLIALGVKQRTAKELADAAKDQREYERLADAATKKPDQEDSLRLPPLNPDIYLKGVSRGILLDGYMALLDEAMDNIDDAYERKQPVRSGLEEFEKYCRERVAMLKAYRLKGDSQSSELQEAMGKTQKAHEDALEALKIVPKTEKKSSEP